MLELDAYGDTDSSREDTIESVGTTSEGDSTSGEVGNDETAAGSPPRTLFTPP